VVNNGGEPPVAHSSDAVERSRARERARPTREDAGDHLVVTPLPNGRRRAARDDEWRRPGQVNMEGALGRGRDKTVGRRSTGCSPRASWRGQRGWGTSGGAAAATASSAGCGEEDVVGVDWGRQRPIPLARKMQGRGGANDIDG
jgi:hypothetical protein